jgi:IS30 family transposase
MAHHLKIEERDRLAHMLHRGATQAEIARDLDRSEATISRELHRNRCGDSYYAGHAQQLAQQRRRQRPLQRKMEEPQVNASVRRGLAQDWSPDEIAGRLRAEHPHDRRRQVSRQTIYNWIKQEPCRKHWESHLRRRGRRPLRRRNKPRNADAARIAERPDVIEQRLRLGDFEGDTVLGPPGRGGLATLVDRKSRLTIIVKIRSKQADHVHQKIRDRLKLLEEDQCRSVTLDNGTEFARCHRLEKHLGLALYYAEPGRPYQRGTNENTNGLIRQYFPKGTDFRNISHHQIREVENLLNNRPRACLGYKTPNELFFEKDTPHPCD